MNIKEIVIGALCVGYANVVCGQGQCAGMTPCYCQFENGQFLDISPLGRTDGLPRFVNISDEHEISYSWNPCFNFTEGDCVEAAVCAIEPSTPHDIYLILGYQKQTVFQTNTSDDSVTLVYTASKKSAFVKLVCDRESLNNTYFKAIGPKSQTSTEYYFELHSPLACPQGTPRPSSTTAAPPLCRNHEKLFKIGFITVSVLCVLLLGLLVIAILKIKGKICKKIEYDNL